MKREGKFGIKDVSTDVAPSVGRGSPVINDNLGELPMELLSKFRRDSQGFDVAPGDPLE